MKSMHSLFAFAGILLCSTFASAANSAEIPQQAFQAEYEITGPTGTSVHKLACDGKGHGRSEMISQKRHSISIADYTNHKMSIVTPGMGSFSMPLDDKMIDSMSAFSKTMKENSKALGTKLIDGHVCTGTQYKLGDGFEEIWTGNDIGGARVYSKVSTPGAGITEAHLKSFSRVAPGAQMFELPAQ